MPELARQRAATLEFWRADAQARPCGSWLDLGDGQLHSVGLAVEQWNGLLLRRTPADAAALVTRAAAWFGERGMPYGVLVPAELDVTPPGCSWQLDHPVMLRGLADLPPVTLPAGVVLTTTAPAAQVAAVQAQAFGDPYEVALAFVEPVLTAAFRRTVTLLEDGEAVATACLALTPSAAGVYDVAVLPSARGRGLGTAVTAWCLAEAARAGADLAYLNPSAAAHGLYARLGFTDAPPWRVYAP